MALLLASATIAADISTDWARWRGPNADGMADARELSMTWSQAENVCWSESLTGWGASSLAIYGKQVFVTSQTKRD